MSQPIISYILKELIYFDVLIALELINLLNIQLAILTTTQIRLRFKNAY